MTVSRRIVAPALGVVASCLLLLATGGLDQGVPGGRLGPAFWPRLVLIHRELNYAAVSQIGENVKRHLAEIRAAVFGDPGA